MSNFVTRNRCYVPKIRLVFGWHVYSDGHGNPTDAALLTAVNAYDITALTFNYQPGVSSGILNANAIGAYTEGSATLTTRQGSVDQNPIYGAWWNGSALNGYHDIDDTDIFPIACYSTVNGTNLGYGIGSGFFQRSEILVQGPWWCFGFWPNERSGEEVATTLQIACQGVVYACDGCPAIVPFPVPPLIAPDSTPVMGSLATPGALPPSETPDLISYNQGAYYFTNDPAVAAEYVSAWAGYTGSWFQSDPFPYCCASTVSAPQDPFFGSCYDEYP